MKDSVKMFFGGVALLMIGLIVFGWYQSYMRNLFLSHENNLLRDNSSFLANQNALLFAQNGQVIADNQTLNQQLSMNIVTEERNPIGFKK